MMFYSVHSLCNLEVLADLASTTNLTKHSKRLYFGGRACIYRLRGDATLSYSQRAVFVFCSQVSSITTQQPLISYSVSRLEQDTAQYITADRCAVLQRFFAYYCSCWCGRCKHKLCCDDSWGVFCVCSTEYMLYCHGLRRIIYSPDILC